MYLRDARIWLRSSHTGGMKSPRRRRGGAKSCVLRRLALTCRLRRYRGLPALVYGRSRQPCPMPGCWALEAKGGFITVESGKGEM
jgi:hypothetical protein